MIKIFADKKEKNLVNFWNHMVFHPTNAIEDDWGKEQLEKLAASYTPEWKFDPENPDAGSALAMLIADMIGLPVYDAATGEKYGEIVSVTDGVRYKLYTVKTDSGNVILPGVDEFIKEIDIERGVFVTVIPGFFD